jgi:hypothetical protein
MGDKVACRELCASRVAMKAETPAEVRDMLPPDLIDHGVHEIVGIDPATEQCPVAAEIPSAKGRRDEYGAIRFGESCPPLYGRLCVPGKVAIRFRAIRPGKAMREDQHPNRARGNERRHTA